MAAYKVIQDIEAEDKLLGPLTFRQFVYAGICAAFLFLVWFVGANGALFLAPVFLPPAVLAGFLAFPWRRDQPTEVWALAKVRFMIKPRKRIWDQSGVKELVTITAPKHIQQNLTKGLSQTEVKSRLNALASTLDSHGWVIKQAGVGAFATAGADATSDPDRLVSASAFQAPVAEEVTPAEDMFDEQNNKSAQRLNDLVNASSRERRQKVIEELNNPQKQTQRTPEKNNWFLNHPGSGSSVPDDMVTFNTQVVTPSSDDDDSQANSYVQSAQPPMSEEQIVKELEARKEESPMKSYYEHMRKILPIDEQRKQAAAEAKAKAEAEVRAQAEARAKAAAKQKAQQEAKAAADPERQAAVRQLASNNDLSVATLAREANEVVIKLH